MEGKGRKGGRLERETKEKRRERGKGSRELGREETGGRKAGVGREGTKWRGGEEGEIEKG